MKVAFFTHYTTLYGANRSLLNLIDGLKTYGVESYVIAPSEGDITNALKEQNVAFATYPIQWWVDKLNHSDKPKFKARWLERVYRFAQYRRNAAIRLYRNLRLVPLLKQQLKQWDVDLVYTNASVTPIGALVAKSLNLPHVWHFREFIDLDYGLCHDWGKFVFNQLVGQADARVAISKAIYAHLLHELPPDRNHIIYNGVASVSEFDRLLQITSLSIRDNKFFTFALLGVLLPHKGQDIAIRALALLVESFPQTRLLIVGQGNDARLRELAIELNVQNNVEFWGHIDDPYKAYLEADVVLMCSKNEGMGRVTVEAMAACRLVIGYDNAGTSEIVQHEQTGLLYQGGFEELAVQMKRCVENPAWGRQIGKNAWQFARNEYSVETYAKNIYKVLLSVVK
ncbi:MAG: glycosyltransferase family 4 protein [Leptolyngbyaceae cyanobacterium SM1_4_3]|nr:glycosyltransferase family 4 protein [Leptolyngbyaceae cyanobacterium SM1_4_3]